MRKIMAPIPDGPKRRDHLFKPGQSGNPRGRPRGARVRLSEAFFRDFLADWEEHGQEALARFREERPHDYVRVMAGLVPKHLNMDMETNELEALSDEELAAQFNALLAELEALGALPEECFQRRTRDSSGSARTNHACPPRYQA